MEKVPTLTRLFGSTKQGHAASRGGIGKGMEVLVATKSVRSGSRNEAKGGKTGLCVVRRRYQALPEDCNAINETIREHGRVDKSIEQGWMARCLHCRFQRLTHG